MARPSRKPVRREHLVAAATRAVGSQGLAGLRVADVAEQAGVVRGSVHYYYPDLSELLREVFRRAVERFCTDRAAMLSTVEDARCKLVAAARAGIPWRADDELVNVLYEFSTAVRQDANYSVIAESLFDRQVTMYGAVLEIGRAQGHFRPTAPIPDIAANLVCLENGYGLEIISGNAVVPPQRAFELILSYARGATGCEDLTADLVEGENS
ncbi:TetR/AcrR family transcriptional regulator [Saccharopolyspora indica]|uniref:TetR/AcrR family transcriptional regulator n=1 Tax=Saccharopolyspora indica TaxID=1229659 RepID=UPI0022EB60DF|nr:TetR/AcrR family transcriptional regulator [Saccharopolyspora indica]MDA3643959.1 TetR/AcrR family transcriptional regulator [Saccharopolyspora indica]